MTTPSDVPRRVFITGASGFIGQALARHYRALGAETCGIDIRPDPVWDVIAADLVEPSGWRDHLAGADLVIHTAAIVSNTATMELAWRVNVQGTAGLLDACARAGVKRFVHLSSVAAYGFDYPADVAEDYPLRPMGNTYVDTKIASEHAVLACHASGRMDCTIVRPGDVYGPGSRPWVVLPLQMIAQGRFLLPAGGEGMFSPVYIDDLVHGIHLAASAAAGRGQIYNIGGGAPVSCREFFGYHCRMLGDRYRLRTVNTAVAIVIAETGRRVLQALGRPTELGRGAIDMLSRRHGYSIEKAHSQLGYRPGVSLEEGMRLTETWVREQNYVA